MEFVSGTCRHSSALLPTEQGCIPAHWIQPGTVRRRAVGGEKQRIFLSLFFFLLFFWHFIYAHPLSEAELPMSLSKGGTLPTAQLLMVLGIPRHVGQLTGRPMQTSFTHPCNSSALPAMLCCLIQAGCFWLSEICNPTTTHLRN